MRVFPLNKEPVQGVGAGQVARLYLPQMSHEAQSLGSQLGKDLFSQSHTWCGSHFLKIFISFIDR